MVGAHGRKQDRDLACWKHGFHGMEAVQVTTATVRQTVVDMAEAAVEPSCLVQPLRAWREAESRAASSRSSSRHHLVP